MSDILYNGVDISKSIYNGLTFDATPKIINALSITALPAKKSLQETSWADIDIVSRMGLASEYWSVGDEKTFEILNETEDGAENVTVQIWGFNHDDLADGSGKAGITFGMKNLLTNPYSMNNSDTNGSGWNSSVMRTNTLSTILSRRFMVNLLSVIKQVNKKTTSGNLATTITTSVDKLFLFSMIEIVNQTGVGYSDEGSTYEYWTTRTEADNRIKKLSNGAGDPAVWWSRSPLINRNSSFRTITGTGSIGNAWGSAYKSATTNCGVCFGFCI